MLRKIIQIDEELCDGCAECIPSCHEGALQIIDGKCRLVSDLFCDGLGACVGECTKGALKIIEAESMPYDEIAVINSMLDKPVSVMQAHLSHLFEHGETEYLNQAIGYLESIGIKVNIANNTQVRNNDGGGCPGSKMMELNQYKLSEPKKENLMENESMLGHWPVQLHLVNPNAQFLRGKKLMILASCVPVAYANTHNEYLKGNSVVIACPKLDYTDPYPRKIEELITVAGRNDITVVRMEVPCCSGITTMCLKAVSAANNPSVLLTEHIISTDGRKINERVISSN